MAYVVNSIVRFWIAVSLGTCPRCNRTSLVRAHYSDNSTTEVCYRCYRDELRAKGGE